MKPVKTDRANQVFNPPPGGDEWCDPVWVERTTFQSGPQLLPAIKLTYELDPNDLVHLNHGARVELTIIGHSMPPVSMDIAAAPAAATRTPGPPTPPVPPGPRPVG